MTTCLRIDVGLDDDDECMNVVAAHAAFVMTVSAVRVVLVLPSCTARA